MAEELLEKIPVEARWAFTATNLWRLTVLRGDKIIASIMGEGEGVIAPVMGAEKWFEINEKLYGDGGGMMYSMIKKMLNLHVEDAVSAAKLSIVALNLLMGPGVKTEIVETTLEKTIVRIYRCVVWDRYDEFKVLSEHRACLPADPNWNKKGLKAIDSKVTFKLTKARPLGNPYCEWIFEFKEE